VALECALRNPRVLTGLVLSPRRSRPARPCLRSGVQSPVSRQGCPQHRALAIEASAVSRDPAVVRAYQQDPLVFHGSCPRARPSSCCRPWNRCRRAHQLRLPLLVQHGSADRLVPLAAVQPLYQRLGDPKLRTLRVYEGLFHEIYNEPERDRVIATCSTGWRRWVTSRRADQAGVGSAVSSNRVSVATLRAPSSSR